MYQHPKNLSEEIAAMRQSDVVDPIWESHFYAQRSIALEKELKTIERLPLTFVLYHGYTKENWILSVFYFLVWIKFADK